FLCFAKRAAHGRRYPRQPLFQHVIHGPALERLDSHLLAERARYEEERHVRALPPGYRQSRKPVERRQGIVGEYEIGLVLVDTGDEIGFGFDAGYLAHDAVGLEHSLYEL